MTQALNFSSTDDSEEIARAEVYGLLAHLFYAPPSAELYEQLQVAVTEAPVPGAFLESAWSEVVAASRRLDRRRGERRIRRAVHRHRQARGACSTVRSTSPAR